MMRPPVAEPRILVTCHSAQGQTAKIADRIADQLREDGASVDLHPIDAAPSPADYDAVVVGDAIHMSRHSKALTDYLRQYADVLDSMPTALFQVSITSIGADAEHTAKAQEMVNTLLAETGFEPGAVGLFAGALAYTKYGWVKRRMVRAIAEKAGLDTDITHDREYTDWDAVARFTHEVLGLAANTDHLAVPAKTIAPQID